MNARPVGTEYTAAIPGGLVLGPIEAPDVVAASESVMTCCTRGHTTVS